MGIIFTECSLLLFVLHNSTVRKETDDGDFKYYQQRVQQWKEQETRFTGEFKQFDGGFKIPIHLWDSLYT